MRIWITASRPRTLPAIIGPVFVGTALAATITSFHALAFLAAMVGAIFIQIGTNLANDYSDARRGADTEDRLGPVRVTAGGLIPPRHVLIATWIAFGIAFLAGIYLIAIAGWGLLAIGVASIAAGVLYTGGPKPYGYQGLGELFVFLFFGVVAVVGSFFVQAKSLSTEAFLLAIPVGMLAAAILMVNNIRDLQTDKRAGKRTLAVQLGRTKARRLFVLFVYGAFLLTGIFVITTDLTPWVMLSWLALITVPPVIRTVTSKTDGAALNLALAHTARLQLIFCGLLAIGLLIGK